MGLPAYDRTPNIHQSLPDFEWPFVVVRLDDRIFMEDEVRSQVNDDSLEYRSFKGGKLAKSRNERGLADNRGAACPPQPSRPMRRSSLSILEETMD